MELAGWKDVGDGFCVDSHGQEFLFTNKFGGKLGGFKFQGPSDLEKVVVGYWLLVVVVVVVVVVAAY